jgi:uncharacterized membrane protein
VLAIIITIMVLELNVPEGHTLHDLWDETGVSFLTYVLSFVYIGIYWNNHHHMFQLCEKITGAVLWANLHLLFWLSLLPVHDGLDGRERPRAHADPRVRPQPVRGRHRVQDPAGADHPWAGWRGLREAMGTDVKGIVSPALYVAGILLVFVSPLLGLLPFVAVAVIWLVPDRRIETYLAEHEAQRS